MPKLEWAHIDWDRPPAWKSLIKEDQRHRTRLEERESKKRKDREDEKNNDLTSS